MTYYNLVLFKATSYVIEFSNKSRRKRLLWEIWIVFTTQRKPEIIYQIWHLRRTLHLIFWEYMSDSQCSRFLEKLVYYSIIMKNKFLYSASWNICSRSIIILFQSFKKIIYAFFVFISFIDSLIFGKLKIIWTYRCLVC